VHVQDLGLDHVELGHALDARGLGRVRVFEVGRIEADRVV
jgi:hypothetical protein